MKYTIDASVMARWFIPGEEYEEEALKIRNDYAQGKIQLYAPTPIKYEVLNSIWKAVTRKTHGNKSSKITIYDATYITTAKKQKAH